MKKVLIITYYWPPSAGVGVQRWMKFVKYLPSFGWEPIIFTPENPDFNIKDNSLHKNVSPDLEIIKFPIWEPFKIFNALSGGKNQENIKQGLVLEKKEPSFKDKLSIWIRGNILIPDSRVFWINPSVKFLTQYVKEREIQYIITTGPPHSMHLIGRGLKKKTGATWIADFRDPWSNWDLLDKLNTTGLSRFFHKNLEKKVLKNADKIITVSKNLAKDLEKIGGKKVNVITNGVDSEDFVKNLQQKLNSDKFRISYFGLLNEMRDPENLWEALKFLINKRKDFSDHLEINLAGIVSESILSKLQNDPLLGNKIKYHAYLTHEQVFKECEKSAVLLLLLNKTDNAKWIIPGKLFEYLAMGNPIIMLGPEESDAASLLKNYNAGDIADFNNKNKIIEILENKFDEYLKGELVILNHDLEPFSRKNLTGELADLLDNL
ncbi:glycosyltransferase family 4 protein [soil metagenome]